MTPLTKVKNLGKVSARWLAEIGIHSKEDLAHIGAVEAYKALRAERPTQANLNALWAMYAGLHDKHWLEITQEEKEKLKKQL